MSHASVSHLSKKLIATCSVAGQSSGGCTSFRLAKTAASIKSEQVKVLRAMNHVPPWRLCGKK